MPASLLPGEYWCVAQPFGLLSFVPLAELNPYGMLTGPERTHVPVGAYLRPDDSLVVLWRDVVLAARRHIQGRLLDLVPSSRAEQSRITHRTIPVAAASPDCGTVRD